MDIITEIIVNFLATIVIILFVLSMNWLLKKLREQRKKEFVKAVESELESLNFISKIIDEGLEDEFIEVLRKMREEDLS